MLILLTIWWGNYCHIYIRNMPLLITACQNISFLWIIIECQWIYIKCFCSLRENVSYINFLYFIYITSVSDNEIINYFYLSMYIDTYFNSGLISILFIEKGKNHTYWDCIWGRMGRKSASCFSLFGLLRFPRFSFNMYINII